MPNIHREDGGNNVITKSCFPDIKVTWVAQTKTLDLTQNDVFLYTPSICMLKVQINLDSLLKW